MGVSASAVERDIGFEPTTFSLGRAGDEGGESGERARAETNVPPAVPIVNVVNVVVGVDFRVPTIDGWEAKIEAGFFDAFLPGAGRGLPVLGGGCGDEDEVDEGEVTAAHCRPCDCAVPGA